MADVKMIATRESYGNTLKALAAEGHDDLVVLDAQERYVVSGVYHHPDVGMDRVEWGSRRHMYVNPDHHGGMTVR